MEDKKHPIREEEENTGMVCEPIGTPAYNETEVVDIPIMGPSTWEDALADLDVSEKEFEAGECIPWENVMEEIKERYKSYAY